MNAQERYGAWVNASWISDEHRAELTALTDEKEIIERFYQDMVFGTAGMRGYIGMGTNYMNVYTVRRATQGLADYMKKMGGDSCQKGVAIAYDCRRFSKEFAMEAALVLCASGIHAYLYDSLHSVPQLSYTVRELGTQAGIVITASHNPKRYNGYKVYWEDGGQLPPEPAGHMLACIESIEDYGSIPSVSEETAKQKGLLHIIGKEMDDKYIAKVKTLVLDQKLLDDEKDMCVVYTPLHGTGNIPVRRVLQEVGLRNVQVVKEQEMPDGDFSTVVSPNPEDPKALALAIVQAEALGADLVIGTDPDCDRIALAVRKQDGGFVTLSGNQTGCLLLHYILHQMKENGTLPKNGATIKTIVTTEMARRIAESFGVVMEDVLTGFKFIAEKIKGYELKGDKQFIFGFEESYGYLAGDFVRDKDGVIASLMAVQTAAYYKKRGMTLYDGLQELYETYGHHVEHVVSLAYQGKEGFEKMARIMDTMRHDWENTLCALPVIALRDYFLGERISVKGTREKLLLPTSDVLYFELTENCVIVIRPSGTEPKIKAYFLVSGKTQQLAEQKLESLSRIFMSVVEKIA